MKVSQAQIARDLGVSQALVSLALNGRKTGINPDTYQRIWDRAAELGYAPKGMHMDTALASRRTRQVGYILRSPLRLYTQSNFFSHVQHGLHATLEAVGCSAVFLGAEDELSDEKLTRTLADLHSLIGVVLLGEVQLRFLDKLRTRQKRIVAISASYPGFCHSVNSNEQQAVDLLIDHLVSLGHTQIGWIGGNVTLGRYHQRRAAFRNALELRGIETPEEFCVNEVEADRAQGAAAVQRLLTLSRRKAFPTAVVCYNGLMARGVVNALHKAGVSVPDDMNVTSIDHTRVLTEEHPFITGAGAIPEKMGEAATQLLLERTGNNSESFYDIVLPAHLRVGDSTGAVLQKS